MNYKYFILLALLLLLSIVNCSATHISGGDFTVEHLSDSTFEVTLTIFRDVSGSNLQPVVSISVYEEGSTILLNDLGFDMPLDSAYFLDLGDECFDPGLMLEIGIYKEIITLPSNPNGYYLVWERCCRNALAINMVSPGVEGPGMVFLVTIPDPAFENSTPVFTPYPTNGYLCVNGSTSIDFSATDADGDSLVYRLVTPLAGTTTAGGSGGGPKPHDPITWQAPYDLSDIVGGAPPMSIDSQSGLLTADPDVQGLFVLAIEVDEYRDGSLMGTIRREIQLESIICVQPVPPEFVDFDPVDTIQVYPLVDNLVNIVVSAAGSNISTTVSGEIITPGFEPLAIIDTLGVGANEVVLTFQWDSIPCDMIGEFFLLEFVAESFSECLDTVLTTTLDLYVEVIVDPDVATNYISPVVDSYEIVFGQSDTYSFPVVATDGNPTDLLTLSMISDINGVNPIVFEGDTAYNVVSSDFSWIITCDDIQDDPYNVTFQTVTSYCETQDTTLYNLELNVVFPADDSTVFVAPDSVMWYNINGEEHCFNVRAEDDNNIDTLTLIADRITYPFSAQNMATFSDISSVFVVESEFCWTPECDEIDPGIYTVDFTVITKNCEIIQETQQRVTINILPTTDGDLNTIPNVFTPNGDAFNELYQIPYTPDYCVSNYNLSIYNRWGNTVFQTQNRDTHWDGTNNGNEAADGVYYVRITYKHFDVFKEYSETIHLFR